MAFPVKQAIAGQKVVSIAQWATVREALDLMVKSEFSQLPVVA